MRARVDFQVIHRWIENTSTKHEEESEATAEWRKTKSWREL